MYKKFETRKDIGYLFENKNFIENAETLAFGVRYEVYSTRNAMIDIRAFGGIDTKPLEGLGKMVMDFAITNVSREGSREEFDDRFRSSYAADGLHGLKKAVKCLFAQFIHEVGELVAGDEKVYLVFNWHFNASRLPSGRIAGEFYMDAAIKQDNVEVYPYGLKDGITQRRYEASLAFRECENDFNIRGFETRKRKNQTI